MTAEPVTAQAPMLVWPQIFRQHWRNVSFLHWAVEPASIVHLYPPDTVPDTFEDRSFVGVVPFKMSLFGTFLETNVRLYSVDVTGRRGVVFLRLDASRPDIVAAMRCTVGVPYSWARMTYWENGNHVAYTSRIPRRGVASTIEVRIADPLTSGPLEHFLTARWGAHFVRFGQTWYMPNAHPAWALRHAELIDFSEAGLLASVGLGELSGRAPDHVAFSDGVSARFGRPVLATTPRTGR